MEILSSTPGFVYVEKIETKTLINEAESGKEKTRAEWPTATINGVTQACAKRTMRLRYNAIEQATYNTICQFFLARVGRKEAFWWENFNESPISNLYPSYILVDGDYSSEDTTSLAHYPIIPASQTIYDDGTALTEGVDYSLVDATGIITWLIKPALGSVIRANYRFYREVRFTEDYIEPERIAYQKFNLELVVREIAPRV